MFRMLAALLIAGTLAGKPNLEVLNYPTVVIAKVFLPLPVGFCVSAELLEPLRDFTYPGERPRPVFVKTCRGENSPERTLYLGDLQPGRWKVEVRWTFDRELHYDVEIFRAT